MPKDKHAGLLELRDALLDLEQRAAATHGRSYSRRHVTRLLAPGNQSLQRRWNNRLHRWLTDSDALVRPASFAELWPLVVCWSELAGETPDRGWWEVRHAASDPAAAPLPTPLTQLTPLPPADESAPRGHDSSAWLRWGVAALILGAVLVTFVVVRPGRDEPLRAEPASSDKPTDVATQAQSPAWLSDSPQGVLRGSSARLNALAFRPDGSELVSAGDDGSVSGWAPGAAKPEWSVVPNTWGLLALTFAPEGDSVLTGGWEGVVYAIDPDAGVVTEQFPDESAAVTALAVSADNRWVAIGTDALSFRVRALDTAEIVAEQKIKARPTEHGASHAIGGLAFSPDGQSLATAGPDDVVRVWDTGDWSLQASLEAHSDLVTDVVFSADGEQLVSASEDDTVVVWETKSWRPVDTLRGHESGVWEVAISAGGDRVAAVGLDGVVRSWELPSGAMTAFGERQVTGPVWDVALTPDAAVAASTHESERAIRLWRLDR